MMSNEEWGRTMRAIWLLNTIEVELSHLGIPLMRVNPTLRSLGITLEQASMSEQDRQLIEDELTRAHASLAQAMAELQAGMSEIEALLRRPRAISSEQPLVTTNDNGNERERSMVWQKS